MKKYLFVALPIILTACLGLVVKFDNKSNNTQINSSAQNIIVKNNGWNFQRYLWNYQVDNEGNIYSISSTSKEDASSKQLFFNQRQVKGIDNTNKLEKIILVGSDVYLFTLQTDDKACLYFIKGENSTKIAISDDNNLQNPISFNIVNLHDDQMLLILQDQANTKLSLFSQNNKPIANTKVAFKEPNYNKFIINHLLWIDNNQFLISGVNSDTNDGFFGKASFNKDTNTIIVQNVQDETNDIAINSNITKAGNNISFVGFDAKDTTKKKLFEYNLLGSGISKQTAIDKMDLSKVLNFQINASGNIFYVSGDNKQLFEIKKPVKGVFPDQLEIASGMPENTSMLNSLQATNNDVLNINIENNNKTNALYNIEIPDARESDLPLIITASILAAILGISLIGIAFYFILNRNK